MSSLLWCSSKLSITGNVRLIESFSLPVLCIWYVDNFMYMISIYPLTAWSNFSQIVKRCPREASLLFLMGKRDSQETRLLHMSVIFHFSGLLVPAWNIFLSCSGHTDFLQLSSVKGKRYPLQPIPWSPAPGKVVSSVADSISFSFWCWLCTERSSI